LAAFSTDPRAFALNGAVSASGELHRTAGELSGHGNIDGRDLIFQQFTAKHLSIVVPVEHDAAHVTTFTLDINGKDQLKGSGWMDLREPFDYEAQLAGNVRDIAILQPIVGSPLNGEL